MALLGCGLCGPFATGKRLLVCVNYYNGYPEVEKQHKIDTSHITNKLQKLFCRYGAPETFFINNSLQFCKNKISQSLMPEFGICHLTVTLYHQVLIGEEGRYYQQYIS